MSQILVIVLKNRSNEIRGNEIRIKQELPVFEYRSHFFYYGRNINLKMKKYFSHLYFFWQWLYSSLFKTFFK